MSRRSTASSRGYVGDVSAGSVYASGGGGTVTDGTVRTAAGVRVPKPTGDPTGEGYARQYQAYSEAGGSIEGMAVPTYAQPTTVVTTPTRDEGYRVSGRVVTPEQYASARAEAVAKAATQWQQQKIWQSQLVGDTGITRTMPRQLVSKEEAIPLYKFGRKKVTYEQYVKAKKPYEEKAAQAWQQQKVYYDPTKTIRHPYRFITTDISEIPDYYTTLYKKRIPVDVTAQALAQSEWERWHKGTFIIPYSEREQEAIRAMHVKEAWQTKVAQPTKQFFAYAGAGKPWQVLSKDIRDIGKAFGFEKYHARRPVGKALKVGTEFITSPTGLFQASTITAGTIGLQTVAGKVLPWYLSRGVSATKLTTAAKVARVGLTVAKHGVPAVYAGSVAARTAAGPPGTLGKIVVGEVLPFYAGAWAGSAFIPPMETKIWRSPSQTEYKGFIKTQEGKILSLGEKAPFGGQVYVKGLTAQRYKTQLYWGEYPIATAKYGIVQRTYVLKGELPTPKQVSVSLVEYGKKGYMRYEVFATPKTENVLTIKRGYTKPSIEETLYLGKVKTGEAGQIMKIASTAGRAGEPVFLSQGELKGAFVKYPQMKIVSKGWSLGYTKELKAPSTTVWKGKISTIIQPPEVMPEISWGVGKMTTIVVGKALAGYTKKWGTSIFKAVKVPVYKPIKKTVGTVFGFETGQKMLRLKALEVKGFQIDLWTGKGVSVPARPPTQYEAKYGISKGKTLVAYIPPRYSTISAEPEVIKKPFDIGGGDIWKDITRPEFKAFEPLTPQKLAEYQQGMLYDMDYTMPISRTAFEQRSIFMPISLTGLSQKQIQQQQQQKVQLVKLQQKQAQQQVQKQQSIPQQIQKLEQRLIQKQSSAQMQVQSQAQVQQQIQQQKQIQQQIQKLQQRHAQITKITLQQITKVPPPPPFIPPLGRLPVPRMFKSYRPWARVKTLTGYTPQFGAIALGITAFKIPKPSFGKAYGVFQMRPVIISKVKKVKRKRRR